MSRNEGETPARNAAGTDVAATAAKILTNVERVILGKRTQIKLALVAYLCEGHILLEDVPGVAKTMLARGVGAAAAASSSADAPNAFNAPKKFSRRSGLAVTYTAHSDSVTGAAVGHVGRAHSVPKCLR
jgi:hypothetical protein